MITPQFPYIGDQVIISSGRVLLHSKADTIFLFGKQGVGVSTTKTFNVDAPERTIINSSIVELGLRAKDEGSPVVKGKELLMQLDRLLDSLVQLGDITTMIASKVYDVSDLVPLSVQISQVSDTAKDVKAQLKASALSTTTFTK